MNLADRIRAEADIADRPGQLARLEAIADEVDALVADADRLAHELKRAIVALRFRYVDDADYDSYDAALSAHAETVAASELL